MADKEIEDLENLGDDFGDDFDMDSDADAPQSGREVATQSLKTVGGSFVDSFKNESVLKQATELADGAFRGLVGEDSYRVATDITDHLKTTGENAVKEITEAATPLAEQIRDKLGDDSFIGGLADKIVQAGKKDVGSEESEENKINSKLLGLLEQQNAVNTNGMMQETLQLQGNMDNKKLLSNLAASNFNILQFHNTRTQDYYRKSIELKYRLLFKTEQTFGLQTKAFDTFKNQLENIVKNTSLPDYLKIRSTEAMKQQFMVNSRNDMYQSFMRNRTWIKTFKDNTSDLIGGIGSGVAEGLNGAGEISSMVLDQIEDFDDPMMRKMALDELGAGAAGKTRGLLGKLSGKLLSKTATGRKFDNAVERLTIDPVSVIGKYADKYGDDTLRGKALGGIANLFTTAKDYREVTGLEIEDMDSATFFDIRTKESINVVIPHYLSEILSAVSNEDGKVYDYNKREFISASDSITGVKDDIGRNYGTKFGNRVDSSVRLMSMDSGIELPKDVKTKFIARLLEDGLTDNDISADTIVSDEFLEDFSAKEKLIIRSMVDSAQRDEDGLVSFRKKNDITRGLNSAFSIKINPEDHIKSLIKDGKQSVLVKLGIIKYNSSTGAYVIDNKEYNKYVKKGILDNLDYRVDESILSRKDKIKLNVANRANKIKNIFGKKAENVLDDVLDKDKRNSFFNSLKNKVLKNIDKVYPGFEEDFKIAWETDKKFLTKLYKEAPDRVTDYLKGKLSKEELEGYLKTAKKHGGVVKGDINKKANELIDYAKENSGVVTEEVRKASEKVRNNDLYKTTKARMDNVDIEEELKNGKVKIKDTYGNVIKKVSEKKATLSSPTEMFSSTINTAKTVFEESNERLRTGFDTMVHPEKGDKENIFVKIKDLLENMQPEKKKKYDTDGDGDRDGGWRDIFSRNKKKKDNVKLSKKDEKDGKKGKGIIGLIFGALAGIASLIIGAVGSTLGGLGSILLGSGITLAIKGVTGAFSLLKNTSVGLMRALGGLSTYIATKILGRGGNAAATAAGAASGSIFGRMKGWGKQLWNVAKKNKLMSLLAVGATVGATDMFGDDGSELVNEFQNQPSNQNPNNNNNNNISTDSYGVSDFGTDLATTAGISYGANKLFGNKTPVTRQVETKGLTNSIKSWFMENKTVKKLLQNKVGRKIFKKLPIVRYLFSGSVIKDAYAKGGLWSGIKAGLSEIASIVPVVAAYQMVTSVTDTVEDKEVSDNTTKTKVNEDSEFITKQQDKLDKQTDKEIKSDTIKEKKETLKNSLDKTVGDVDKRTESKTPIKKSSSIGNDLFKLAGKFKSIGLCLLGNIFKGTNKNCFTGNANSDNDTPPDDGSVKMKDGNGASNAGKPITDPQHSLLLDRISKGEGTLRKGKDKSYDITIGYDKWAPNNRDYLWNMTIDEIYELQTYMLRNGAISSAIGRYQFVKGTLKEVVKKTGTLTTTLFNAETQDKLILFRLTDFRKYGEWLAGNITDDAFIHKLSCEFASIGDPQKGGKSHYGQPVGTTVDEMRATLNKMRKVKGMSNTTDETMNNGNVNTDIRGIGGEATVKSNSTTNTSNAPAARVRHGDNIPTGVPLGGTKLNKGYMPTSMPTREEYEGGGVNGASSNGPCNINYLHPERGSWDKNCTSEAVAALKRFCKMMGGSLTIRSAYRTRAQNSQGASKSQHLLGKAFDVEYVDNSIEGKTKMLHAAKAAGFRGIGIYDADNYMHVDVRSTPSAWGPDFHRTTLPAWAREALATAPAEGSSFNGAPASRTRFNKGRINDTFNPPTPSRLNGSLTQPKLMGNNGQSSSDSLIPHLGTVDNINTRGIGTTTVTEKLELDPAVFKDPHTEGILSSAGRREKVLVDMLDGITGLKDIMKQQKSVDVSKPSEKPHRQPTPTAINMNASRTNTRRD